MVLREYTQRHRLDAVAPADYHRHLPEQVARGLPSAELVVFRVADEHSDTAAFSARYGFGLEDCANTWSCATSATAPKAMPRWSTWARGGST